MSFIFLSVLASRISATCCYIDNDYFPQWRTMDRRLKWEILDYPFLEFLKSKIYFLHQILWKALVRPFKWHIGKVCSTSRKNVTLSGKSGKKGLKIAVFHIFNKENGKNIFFAPDILKGLGKTFQMTYWKVL